MKNVIITEKQFDLFLRNKLAESISVPNGMDEGGDENVHRIIDYLRDTYNSDDDERKEQRDNLRQLAKINQVNFDYSNDEAERRRKEILEKKNDEILEWVGKYLQPLRDCWNGKNFMKSKEVAKYSTDKGVYNTQTPKGAYDKLSGDLKVNVINLASFLDKNRLTCIYREFQKQPSVKYSCGLDLKDDSINCHTPIDVLVGTRDANGKIIKKGLLDFSATVKDTDELLSMYDGTRVKTINKEVGLGGEARHISDPDEWSKVAEVAAYKLNDRRAKLYLKSTYGMEMEFGKGNKMFKFGNSKVYKDTLIINFASAIRCPAWNECIMKDACYAKTSEVMYDDAFNSNLKKNLIWEQTKIDSKLMSLMKALLRSYLLNYVQIPFVRNMKKGEEKKNFIWELCQHSLYELRDKYGDDVIKVLKETRRGNLIRLNENGDFIGQWLVDAFEEFAKELELVDINIAAYTCRALNYEAVEHLILNISQQGLVQNQKSKGFAHFFYAIDPKDYSRLGETYDGPNYSLNIVDGKITPVYRKLVDEKGVLKGYYYKCPCGRGKYEYVPSEEAKYTLTCVDGIERDKTTQRFFGETIANGEPVNAAKIRTYFVYDRKNDIFYIKNGNSTSYRILSNTGEEEDNKNDNFDYGTSLPMTIVTASPSIFVDVNEQKVYVKKIVKKENTGVKGVKKDDTSADCYMCRICYARDKENQNDPHAVRYEGGVKEGDVPVYVFVATHGANRGEFQGEQGRKIDGKKISDWIEILRNSTQRQGVMESVFNEDEGMEEEPENDRLAIRCVVSNFIDSVRSRMCNKSAKLNEIKTKFNDMLGRING